MQKACKKCLKIKPIGDFYEHSQFKDNHMNTCKQCISERNTANRKDKPAKPVAWYIFD